MSERVHICVIAKDEGKYLAEWVTFHQIVGIEHITVYNNGSTDNTLEVLQPFVESGFVDVIGWPVPRPAQLTAYQDYINRHRGEVVWCAFLDCDEFLFPVQHDTVPEALAAICQNVPRSAIGVSWICFGSGGQKSYSSEPVIERFTWRQTDLVSVNQHIKSIVYMNQKVLVGGDPHLFNVEHGTFNEFGCPITDPLSPHTSTFLRINHYVTKSHEELIDKVARGRADVIEPYQLRAFDDYHAREVCDWGIQRFLPELKRRLECLV